MSEHCEQAMATLAATLRLAAVAVPVLRRAGQCPPDGLGCALPGTGAAPVEAIARYFPAMGPRVP